MGRSYWYKRWQEDKSFIVENDILKEKAYLYTPFPKTNKYGFQEFNIRKLIHTDVLARYYRMRDKNVLFPMGFHSLGNSSFIEAKRNSNVLDDRIQNIFLHQMLELGIGINENKLIDMRHDEFLEYLDLAFLDLYSLGYIEYKDYQAYFDKDNNKLYDSINNINDKLPTINSRCFVLKIDRVINNIVEDIKTLECPYEVKDSLLKALEPERIMELELSISNNTLLPIETKSPELLGGISYIFLNPEYIDITKYTMVDEYQMVMDYLENGGSSFVYSGSMATNPLTGNDIPIFISTMHECGVYLGIPAASIKERDFAIESGLNIIEIINNGKLINSDLITGLSPDEGRDKIFDAFIDAMVATSRIEYKKEEILISSPDGFGPLFPFLIDNDNKLNSLRGYLPFTFNAQFRPALRPDCNIPGQALNGTMNNLFIDGLAPIISIIYDDVADSESIFSANSISDYKAWGTIKEMVIDKDNYISELLMPIIFNNIIRNEDKSVPELIHRVACINKSLDSNNNSLKRANNNLIDFNRYLETYYTDSIRLYAMSIKNDDYLIVAKDRLDSYDLMVRNLHERLLNPSDDECKKLDYYFYNLMSECKKALDKCNLYSYTALIIDFIKNVILEEYISKSQCLIFIKCIFPIMPYLADEVYKKVFNSKYSLINESI